jgi:hypothetical protein
MVNEDLSQRGGFFVRCLLIRFCEEFVDLLLKQAFSIWRVKAGLEGTPATGSQAGPYLEPLQEP